MRTLVSVGRGCLTGPAGPALDRPVFGCGLTTPPAWPKQEFHPGPPTAARPRGETMRKIILGTVVALTGVAVTVVAAGPVGAVEPNCVEFFDENFDSDIANHGQHIIGDYVMGTGHDGEWPPAGQVGETIGGSGAVSPGQSGILKHGASPGASFCNDSNSPASPPGRTSSAFSSLRGTSSAVGFESTGCWPVAADAGNLTGPYAALSDEMVQALTAPTDC